VPEADTIKRHTLACMRMAADCRRLAGKVPTLDLRDHYLRMAMAWVEEASRKKNLN
jgi:hypothetical protein